VSEVAESVNYSQLLCKLRSVIQSASQSWLWVPLGLMTIF